MLDSIKSDRYLAKFHYSVTFNMKVFDHSQIKDFSYQDFPPLERYELAIFGVCDTQDKKQIIKGYGQN